jgi:hypothetical protein
MPKYISVPNSGSFENKELPNGARQQKKYFEKMLKVSSGKTDSKVSQ